MQTPSQENFSWAYIRKEILRFKNYCWKGVENRRGLDLEKGRRVTDAVGAPRKIFGGGPPYSFISFWIYLNILTRKIHWPQTCHVTSKWLIFEARKKGLRLPNREYGVKVTRYGGNRKNTRKFWQHEKYMNKTMYHEWSVKN